MANFVFVHDLIEDNGRTVRENNLAKPHTIPLGTLVEVKFDEWFGDGCCWKVHARLFVVRHDRDCDGTPLYSLSRSRQSPLFGDLFTGFHERRLHPLPVTKEILDGEGVLEWTEEEKT